MSRLIAIFTAVAIALTSQAFALARGQVTVSGEIVICAGGGFVTVALDAKGNPVGPSHFCPDAVIALATFDMSPSLPARPMSATALAAWPVAQGVPFSQDADLPKARAPPVLS